MENMAGFIALNTYALILIIFIMIIFYSKSRLHKTEDNTYSNLLIITALMTFTGIILGFLVIPELNVNEFILSFVNKIYLVFIALWSLLLTFYTFYVSRIKSGDARKQINIFTMFGVILSILIIFLPIKTSIKDGVAMAEGASVAITYLWIAIGYVLMLVLLLLDYKNLKNKKYIPVYLLTIFGSIVFIIQIMTNLNYLINPSLILIVTFMYFTIENPDVKMIEELSKAQKLSEKTNNDKSNFIYTVSEDIQNRLNNAEDIYNRVMSLNPSEDITNEMNNLKEVVIGARNMLNSAIGISDNDNQHLQLTNNKYNIKLLLDSIYSLKKQDVKGDIQFRLNVSNDLPRELYGDSIKLKQILSSVLDNSIKYTNEGFIELRVNSIIKNNICRLIMSVEDSGIGIDIFKQNEIMGNTDDLDKEDIESLNDMNLSLKVVRKMIALIGGTFTIDNNKYDGTTINISLDQKIVEDEKSNEEKQIAKYSEEIKNQKTCAIISLDKDDIRIIKRLAKKNNYKVEEFSVTKNCLDNVRNNKSYDVIFIDEFMEKIDARSFLSKVKEVENFNGKVIVISKNKDIRMKKELLTQGFAGIVYKPLDKKELVNKF